MDVAQVFVQKKSEAQHTDVEEESEGQYQTSGNVHPHTAEGTCVGMGGQDRVIIQLVQDDFVTGIRQVVDGFFQPIVDALDVVVVARVEEHLDWRWPA
jgi:hypothetical protein